VLTKFEAIELLKQNQQGKSARFDNLNKKGYLAYTTAPGWLGYSNEKMISLCDKYKKKGFTAFKIKIGVDLNRDIERCRLMRDQIGFESTFMLDSNQIFDVDQAIEWVKQLKKFKVSLVLSTSPSGLDRFAVICLDSEDSLEGGVWKFC
jgi:L-fuconate dehydratase